MQRPRFAVMHRMPEYHWSTDALIGSRVVDVYPAGSAKHAELMARRLYAANPMGDDSYEPAYLGEDGRWVRTPWPHHTPPDPWADMPF